MEDAVRVPLPGGFWRGERRVRELTLCAPSADDEFFAVSAEHAGPCERATLLLARCLAHAGDEPAALARLLTVGDREALLLQLRRLMLGDVMECVLRCHACGERLELTLRVSELLAPTYAEARPRYDTTLDAGCTLWHVRYRLPTGGDVEAVAALARDDPAAAAAEILRRCVEHVEINGAERRADDLPPDARGRLAAEMASRDPQAELELELRCPACAAEITVVFDAATFLLQELEERTSRVLRDVHTLALHYHWSEAEILRLPAGRRTQYLELLSEHHAR